MGNHMNSNNYNKQEKFLFLPNKPVILKKTFDIQDSSIERQFLFYSTEEQENDNDLFLYKFTIYYCEIVANSSQYPVQNSIVIEGKKNNGIMQELASIRLGGFIKTPKNEKPEDKTDFIIFPPSCGIGSLILNHLIYWGQKYYPKAEIDPLFLSSFDERIPENKIRRDQLYSNIGLINYKGKKLLSELTPTCDSRGFQTIDLHNHLNTMHSNQRNLQSDLTRIDSRFQDLKKRNIELERENRALKRNNFWRIFFIVLFIFAINIFYL